ncbi:MAG: hypothetical protein QW103_00140 [Candidatus Pacearchaeota archaeon]
MKNTRKFKLTTPVLFLIFNRIETTKKVFAEIRKARPTKLYIAADGPRNEEEKKKTDAVRKYVLENIDWPCKVKTLLRDKNLGCKYAVSSAITWFFENEERGIILEDDCLPSQSFFRFCQELLERYKDDERVMQISGTNIERISKIKEDYFFTPCFNAWGWATWRRAWKNYDVEMKEWKKIRFSKNFLEIVKDYSFLDKIKSWRLYQLTYAKKIDTWDYQWIFCCLINNALCIIPKKNLITNIGFKKGTHTTNYIEKEKSLKRFEMDFPLFDNNRIIKSEGYLRVYFTFFKVKKWKKIIKFLKI